MAVENTPPNSLGPSNLLGTVLKGLYHSANAMTQNFGFTIPEALIFFVGLAIILFGWSMIASMRNRKHFSLEDDQDEFLEGTSRLHGGVLRTESRPEGSKGAVI